MKSTKEKIIEECRDIETLLIEKNTAYGDAATNPSNVFSTNSPRASICARIDDKLNRIKNRGINDSTEDTVTDLIGYLILLKIVLKDEQHSRQEGHDIQEPDGHTDTIRPNYWTSSGTHKDPQRIFFSDY
jgi:hypothetical protein